MLLGENRGSVLMLTFVVVLVLATIVTAASFLFVGGTRRARTTIAALQAYYLSEAGVEYAVERLKTTWDIGDEFSLRENFPASDPIGYFDVTVRTVNSEEKEIESKGVVSNYVRDYVKTVKVVIKKGTGFPPIFRNALASKTDIELAGNSRIYSSNEMKAKGNVYGHQRISLGGNTRVSGSVSSALPDGVTTRGSVSIGGGIFTGPQYWQEIPEITDSLKKAWENQARAGGIHSGSLTYSGNNNIVLSSVYVGGNLDISGNSNITLTDNAVIYVKGKVRLSGNASIKGQGIIVSEGVIEITGNMSHKLNQPANIAFVSLSGEESKITGNGEVTGVFFVPEGTLKIAGNSEIFGAVVANRIEFTGNAEIKYNADLMDSDIVWNPLRLFEIARWQEI